MFSNEEDIFTHINRGTCVLARVTLCRDMCGKIKMATILHIENISKEQKSGRNKTILRLNIFAEEYSLLTTRNMVSTRSVDRRRLKIFPKGAISSRHTWPHKLKIGFGATKFVVVSQSVGLIK